MMAVDALVAPLLRVDLFQGLKPLQLTEIARHAERIMFRPGDKITEAGTAADAAFLIVGGAAEVIGTTGEDVEIGSLIGEMAMLIEHIYGSTVVATSAVRCLKINRDAMHTLMIEDRTLAQHLTARISDRLQRVASELRAIDDDCAVDAPEMILALGKALDGQAELTH
jgi:CRP-like cAMP-binding protein